MLHRILRFRLQKSVVGLKKDESNIKMILKRISLAFIAGYVGKRLHLVLSAQSAILLKT